MTAEERPRGGRNVLVFFCDQLRPDLLGCYGGSLVRTPNMDALAADGTVFENAYTPTAICSVVSRVVCKLREGRVLPVAIEMAEDPEDDTIDAG